MSDAIAVQSDAQKLWPQRQPSRRSPDGIPVLGIQPTSNAAEAHRLKLEKQPRKSAIKKKVKGN